jgi:hypothetical protein
MKQSAVEWLVEELEMIENSYYSDSTDYIDMRKNSIELAKLMEKEQQGYTQEKVFEIERYRAIDFAKWFSDFNGLTWEEKRVTKERLDTLYEKYLGTLGGIKL